MLQMPYTVKVGDSLFSISKKLDISQEELQRMNPEIDLSSIAWTPGLRLNTPLPPPLYTGNQTTDNTVYGGLQKSGRNP